MGSFVCDLDDDLETSDGEFDLNEDILNSNFKDDIIAVAMQYVDQFFQDKCLYCGGAIPRHILHSPKRISKIINTSVSDGVGEAYEALEKTLDPEDLKRAEQFGNVTEDIKLVNQTLHTLALHKIPKCFAGGMLLMYLEFCEGVQF